MRRKTTTHTDVEHTKKWNIFIEWTGSWSPPAVWRSVGRLRWMNNHLTARYFRAPSESIQTHLIRLVSFLFLKITIALNISNTWQQKAFQDINSMIHQILNSYALASMMRWLRAEMKLLSEHRNSTRFSSPSSSSKALRTTSPWSSAMVAPWLSKEKLKTCVSGSAGV